MQRERRKRRYRRAEALAVSWLEAGRRHDSGSLHDHDGQIAGQLLVTCMLFDHGEERARQLRRGRGGVGVDRPLESVLVEWPVRLVLRLGDAVAVGHQQVAGLGLFVGGRVELAERDAAGREFLDRPALPPEERWCLPGVDVAEGAGPEVDDREKESDEPGARRLLLDEPVEALDELRGRQIVRREGAQHRQQQRRGAALAGDVPQDDHDAVVVQPQEVRRDRRPPCWPAGCGPPLRCCRR